MTTSWRSALAKPTELAEYNFRNAQRSFTREILNAGNDRNAAGTIAKLEAIRFMIADDFGKKRGMITADPLSAQDKARSRLRTSIRAMTSERG
jgi:hypothetical protein